LKLITKLTLFITGSKLVIVLLFVSILPLLVSNIVSNYTNHYLREQKEKVLMQVEKNGIDYYLQGQLVYGSYTMLKEEYISLEPYVDGTSRDTVETTLRVIEDDTLTYRVLKQVFTAENKKYVLEVGKTIATISQYNGPLQKLALSVLVGLIILTIVVDLVYTHIILKPLNAIISTRLVNRKFPFREAFPPIRTTTSDFIYLDTCLVDLMKKITDAFDKEREFTSNASHELMTPISILQNKLENMIVDSDVSEELQDKIIGMMNTLTRLKKIVRSLLLISRIENEQFTKSDTIDILGLIKEVVEELSDKLETKSLQVKIDIPENLEIEHMNRDLIFQLFYNLVNNAIRYNKEDGAIVIRAERQPNFGCIVYIEDTGIGIEGDELQLIFNRFKKARRAAEDGYGLGLSIVRSIADYHSLNLHVDSVVNEGTTFAIAFP
jgi:two-component system, OmpR family, sensor histidine kinase ArlS